MTSTTTSFTKTSFAKKTALALIAAATLGTGLAASTTSASAWYKGPYYGYGYYHRGPAWGYGAAAVAGGLALGAMAASSYATPVTTCYMARRSFVDDFGNVYVRRVRVCE